MSVANTFYLDASSLAKRYVPEIGSANINAVFDVVAGDRLRILNVGMGEVVSALVRKRNSAQISHTLFQQALLDFSAEIARAKGIRKVSVTSRMVTSSFPLIVAHSINATDARVLKSALVVARRLRADGDDLVLVASDQRLLRAAQAEGLITFDPETQDYAALAALK